MAVTDQLKRVQDVLDEALAARTEVQEVLKYLESYQKYGFYGLAMGPTGAEGDFTAPIVDARALKAKLKTIAAQHASNFPKEFKDLDSEALFNFGCLGMVDLFGSPDLLDKARGVNKALSTRIANLQSRIQEISAGTVSTTVIERAMGAFGNRASGRYTDSSVTEEDAMADFQRQKKLDEASKQRLALDTANKTFTSLAQGVSEASGWQKVLGVALFPARSAGVLVDKAKKGLLIAQYPASFRYCNESRNTPSNLANDFAESKAAAQDFANSAQVSNAKAAIKAEEGSSLGKKYAASDEYKALVQRLDSYLATEAALLASKSITQDAYDGDSRKLQDAKTRLEATTTAYELEASIKWLTTLGEAMQGRIKKAEGPTTPANPPSTSGTTPAPTPPVSHTPQFKPYIPPASNSGAGDTLPAIPVAPATGTQDKATVVPAAQASAAAQEAAVRLPKKGEEVARSNDQEVAYSLKDSYSRDYGGKVTLVLVMDKDTGDYVILAS